MRQVRQLLVTLLLVFLASSYSYAASIKYDDDDDVAAVVASAVTISATSSGTMEGSLLRRRLRRLRRGAATSIDRHLTTTTNTIPENRVDHFQLINTNTNLIITNLMDGAVIDLNVYNSSGNVQLDSLSVHAVTLAEISSRSSGTVFNNNNNVNNNIASIEFTVNGQFIRIENSAPYSLCGDSVTDGYTACGSLFHRLDTKYTMVAKPYTGSYATGVAAGNRSDATVTFSLVVG